MKTTQFSAVQCPAESRRLKFLLQSPLANPTLVLLITPFYLLESVDPQPVYTDKRIQVFASASGFYTDAVEVDFGRYSIVKFIVYDEGNKTILATPYEGSPRAEGLDHVLPVTVDVADEQPVLVFSPNEPGAAPSTWRSVARSHF